MPTSPCAQAEHGTAFARERRLLIPSSILCSHGGLMNTLSGQVLADA